MAYIRAAQPPHSVPSLPALTYPHFSSLAPPRCRRHRQVIRSLLAVDKFVIVVEHDLSVLDYLSDFICCLYGRPGAYGVVTLPFGVRWVLRGVGNGVLGDGSSGDGSSGWGG